MTLASSLGLLASWPYEQETANWILQAQGQDLGNLLAVAVLVLSAIGLRGGSFLAERVWIGTLAYPLYAYVVYAFAVHFGRLFLVYVAVLGLVFYTLIAARPALNPRPRNDRGRARFAAWVLIGTGALFGVLWLSEVIPATITGQAPSSLEVAGLIVNPIHVLDLSVVLPGMILIGVLALRGDGKGLSLVVPALVFSVLMGLSIIAAMVLIVAAGDPSGLPPMVMVAVVVGTSLAAIVALERRSPDARREAAGPELRQQYKDA
ncbi:hypothetical protein [Naasia sp. SYSU D00948]|uniref:hypothetical protein n=1 Tax=Naasia sp. SYSU D00948 TaxID=2817379 RepID=UPI001B30EBC1|nr:hypothetical protein [Naasia sp. SYSU D00948]